MSFYTTPHIHMLDTTTQAIAIANTPQVVTFDTTVITKKLVATTPSRFTVPELGDYLISFGAQVMSTGANKTIDIWYRVNGADVANSNSKITLVSTNDQKRFTINLAVTLAATDYIEIWTSGDSTNLSLQAYAAGTTPTRPVTPSCFLVIEKLS